MKQAGDHDENREQPIKLTPDDEAALDALVEAGFDPDAVEPALRVRSRRVASLLGMLDTPSPVAGLGDASGDEAVRSSMTDRVLGAVQAARDQQVESQPELSREDSEALESFVMSGYNAERTPSGVRREARAHASAHSLITDLGPENERWIAAGRTVRTESILEAVASVSAPIPMDTPVRRRSFRIADLLAAAAALLLVSAFTMPVMNAFSEDGRRRVCTSNLQAAGLGLGLYTIDNNDALPMATAGFGGDWSRVGKPGASQSANLFTLVRTRHVQPWDLACPGNEAAPRGAIDRDAGDWNSLEEVSYSYRLMPRGRARADVLAGDAVLLADRSPLLLAALTGRRVSPEASSPNHGMDGQHLLRLDGVVSWHTSPVLANGDNIWLPRGIERAIQDYRKKIGYIEGTELPESTDDTFLGP